MVQAISQQEFQRYPQAATDAPALPAAEEIAWYATEDALWLGVILRHTRFEVWGWTLLLAYEDGMYRQEEGAWNLGSQAAALRQLLARMEGLGAGGR
ncbi:MAG: hypothetical protein HY532_06365 [Chloroflexi bacterium]|nr:hypothetical protein [Chloroflexota bacterium]